MNLIKVNPFLPVHAPMSDTIEALFNRSMAEMGGSDKVNALPRANVIEKEDAFQIDLAAPGYKKEDFVVEIDKDLLTVKVETSATQNDKNAGWKRREFTIGPFRKSFRLDEKMDTEEIEARYEDGILRLSVPKLKEMTRLIEVS